MLPPVDIHYLAQELARLGEEIQRLAEDSKERLEPQLEVLTDGLAGLLEALAIAAPLSAMDSTPVPNRGLGGDPDALLAHGLDLLTQLIALASRLNQPQMARSIEVLALPLACWLLRRGAELLHPETVVNAAAALANSLREPDELAALYALMSEVMEGMNPLGVQETEGEPHDPATGRPWRVLLLNRAIVATRSHRPTLMVEAFQAVCEHLPEDAPSFFQEGMGRMEDLTYPQPVRELMTRYYSLWCTGQRLH